jgi:hypothetical protein
MKNQAVFEIPGFLKRILEQTGRANETNDSGVLAARLT